MTPRLTDRIWNAFENSRWNPALPFRMKRASRLFNSSLDAREAGDFAASEEKLHQIVGILKGGSPTKSSPSRNRYMLLAAAYNHLGMIGLDTECWDKAERYLDQAIELRKKLRRISPQDRENEIYLGGALCNRGHASRYADPVASAAFYRESLETLRQPTQGCDVCYWDEDRQSWWCAQMEAMGNALGLGWVFQAPLFIDNAVAGLAKLENEPPKPESSA